MTSTSTQIAQTIGSRILRGEPVTAIHVSSPNLSELNLVLAWAASRGHAPTPVDEYYIHGRQTFGFDLFLARDEDRMDVETIGQTHGCTMTAKGYRLRQAG